jgi:Ca-activated chloride channel family protein
MSLAAVSGSDGRYSLTLLDSLRGRELTIRVRRIGYSQQQALLRVRGDSLRADFRLAPSPFRLDHVVVTGMPGAVETLTARSSVASLSAAPSIRAQRGERARARPFNTEAYERIEENPFRSAKDVPLSTFSIDVDRASYANVRRFIMQGQLPPVDAVRLEELVNYFPYQYQEPDDAPVHLRADVAVAPWAPQHRLVRVALQARRVATEHLPPANLVFLMDVSGSMAAQNKLPLLKDAFLLLVDQLRPQDRVAIVVYAGSAGLVLPSTPASDKTTIRTAIDRLGAGGSTAGGAGIALAYKVARENFIAGGNNRVILATDGDFNVGASSDAEMERLIEEKRTEGTFLTVLGFGMGNYKDAKLEKLADRGNGNYAYVDSRLEARKVLVTELGATLLTVAKDVKLQVEFNPAQVKSYRLLGYENRLLNDEDFTNDAKDAGDMGAGHSVTAFYEVVPTGGATGADGAIEQMRYQNDRRTTAASRSNELLQVKLRYKERDGNTSRELRAVVLNQPEHLAGDFAFAAAVAEFALLLRDSKYKGLASVNRVLASAEQHMGTDADGTRRGFLALVKSYSELRQRVAAGGER